jgi:AcrR family transcriptional regulator
MRLLLHAAMEIVKAGHIPSVSEVAEAADVSRATAYRYFPTRSALVTAIVDASLGPVRTWKAQGPDGRARLEQLFDTTFPRFEEFEAQLRAALQLSQEHWLLANANQLNEEPFRRGHRLRILDGAAKPLKSVLGPTRYRKMLAAISVVYGIEPYVVLKDMWKMSGRETFEVTRWMMHAIVCTALAEAEHANERTLKKSKSNNES